MAKLKKLKKLELIEGYESLTDQEMKSVIGGSYTYECVRTHSDGKYGTFVTSNGEFAGGWVDVWNAMGWRAGCRAIYSGGSYNGYMYT